MSHILSTDEGHATQCRQSKPSAYHRLVIAKTWPHLDLWQVWMKALHCASVVIVPIYEPTQDAVTAAITVIICCGVVASIPSVEITIRVA